jgi:hypothetical protein
MPPSMLSPAVFGWLCWDGAAWVGLVDPMDLRFLTKNARACSAAAAHQAVQ